MPVSLGTEQMMKYLAQRHNAVPLLMLKAEALRSEVYHSTTESPNYKYSIMINNQDIQCEKIAFHRIANTWLALRRG